MDGFFIPHQQTQTHSLYEKIEKACEGFNLFVTERQL